MGNAHLGANCGGADLACRTAARREGLGKTVYRTQKARMLEQGGRELGVGERGCSPALLQEKGLGVDCFLPVDHTTHFRLGCASVEP